MFLKWYLNTIVFFPKINAAKKSYTPYILQNCAKSKKKSNTLSPGKKYMNIFRLPYVSFTFIATIKIIYFSYTLVIKNSSKAF